MDYGKTEELEKEPAEMRGDMRDTRAALTEKLELLEDRVSKKTEDIQHRVEATADKVKETVNDTVRVVKETVDWRHQMQEHPWGMFGGAVFAGFMLGRLIGSSSDGSTFTPRLPTTPTTGASEHDSHHASSFVDKAMGQFNVQRDRLEQAAVSAASDFVEKLISRSLPGISQYLR
jgi:ElaB/YqjD/DUF883 family membrane-anchored ribosome-binding protein